MVVMVVCIIAIITMEQRRLSAILGRDEWTTSKRNTLLVGIWLYTPTSIASIIINPTLPPTATEYESVDNPQRLRCVMKNGIYFEFAGLAMDIVRHDE